MAVGRERKAIYHRASLFPLLQYGGERKEALISSGLLHSCWEVAGRNCRNGPGKAGGSREGRKGELKVRGRTFSRVGEGKRGHNI